MIKVQVQLTLFLQGFFFFFYLLCIFSTLLWFLFFLTHTPGEPLGTISSLTRINVTKYILVEQTILREAALLESVCATQH